MKLSRKSLSALLGVLALGCVAGTLIWELVERRVAAAGYPLDWSLGPISLDLHAISISVRVNPGSLLGLIAGGLLFRAL